MSKKITFLVLFLLFGSTFQMLLAQPYSNGGLSTGSTSNSAVAAPSGFTWSECQNSTGNTTESNTNAGYSGNYNTANTTSFQLADDFIVPTGEQWNVTGFDFYCYQTGYAGTTPPIDALRVQLWNGDPSSGTATSVAGNMTTNVYSAADSGDGLMYRIFNSAVPTPGTATGTTRKIWRVRANLTTTLPAGTYWVVYQAHATNDGSLFFPPVTISGSRGLAGWNSKQNNVPSSTWTSLIDAGNPATAPDFPQDMPFNIQYTVTLANEDFNLSNVKLFPNPTNDSFSLAMDDVLLSKIKNIEIFSFQGQKVKTFSVQENYSIKELSSGIYFAKLIGEDDNELQNIRIIKE